MLPLLRTLLSRLRALFISRRLDEEFDAEVQTHITLLTGENIDRGMTQEEAHYAALRAFGGVTQTKERNRERRTVRQLEILGYELRYSARTLRKNPGFAAVAIATVALGIGANTAIFELLDAVRIRSLPVKNPQELVEIKLATTDDRRGSMNRFGQLTNPLWERIGKGQEAFSGMLAWGEGQFNLANGGESRYARGMMVSGNFFNVLGVPPILGRVFTPADDRKGCGAPVAVISHSFWQREFAANPSVVGRTLSLDSHPAEIIGVTPPSFFGLEVGQSYDVAVPICADDVLRGESSRLNDGATWWLVALGRLNPGWSLDRANAELQTASPGIFQATLPPNYPAESVKSYLHFQLAAYPAGGGLSQLRNDYTDSLWLLLGASGLVLLIACANLANLMLARASARDREIAVRLALGATRSRLLRQLMTESVLLAMGGSLLGLWLARGLSRVLVSFLDINGSPVFLDLHADWRVLSFNAALAILTCMLFGLAPALRAAATDPGAAMKSAGRALTAGRERFRLRKILVVSQVALSLVLVAGALLFSRSLRNLLTVDTGFQQSNIAIAGLDLGRLDLPAERRLEFKKDLLGRVLAIPGIESAATTDVIPMSGDSTSNTVWMDGQDSQRVDSLFNRVSPEFFKTLQIPLLAGRTFDGRDLAGGAQVVIVNQAFARRLTGGANPVGRRFWRQRTPREPQTLYEIVGLVKDTKYIDLREDFRPIAFLASSQDPRPDLTALALLRSRLPLAEVRSAVKRAVADVSPAIVIDFDTMPNLIQGSLLRERLMATLSGFFGVLAVLLAGIGLYGVLSYMVARRTNEIGIRMALGADRVRVVNLMMREAAGLLATGLALGLTLAWIAARAAGSLLYGLKARDPGTLALAAASLAVISMAASYLPSRRAARLDPLDALREE